MRIRPGNAQHIGSRDEQQDSFAFSHIEDNALVRRAGVLAAVADGMGGLAMGKEASDLTVKTVLSVHETAQINTSPTEILQKAVESANINVYAMAQDAGVEGDAGSTLVAAIVKDNKLYWISVGDSRIYLYRKGELTQLTTDQNYATELLQSVADGRISIEEAQSHPDRAALTNFIGSSEIKPADSSRYAFPVYNGDWIILCSDGLFGTLTDDEIRKELHDNPHNSCERLIKKVVSFNKPYQDNTTVVILACGESDPVTVRTKKTNHRGIFPKADEITRPISKKEKSIWIFLLVCLLIAVISIGGMTYLFWPQINQIILSVKKEIIQKQPSDTSETKKTHSKEITNDKKISRNENLQKTPSGPSQAKKANIIEDTKDTDVSR